MIRFSSSLTTLLAVALALSASIPVHAAGKIQACKLIAPTQASKVMGVKLTAKAIQSAAAGADAGSMCSYTGGGLHGGFTLLAAKINYSDAKTEVADQEKRALSDTPPFLPKPKFRSVAGLGDGAYLMSYGISSFQLHVLSRGNAIVISRNTKMTSGAVSQSRKLAEIALGNL